MPENSLNITLASYDLLQFFMNTTLFIRRNRPFALRSPLVSHAIPVYIVLHSL